MPLVNGRILLDRIQEKRVLAGAFNTTNLETTISILNAIERSGLPNFIQIAPTNAQLSGYDYIYEIVKRHADKMDVPVSLHLDHGKTQEDVKQAVRAEQDPYEMCEAMGKNLVHIHINDNRPGRDCLLPGRGEMDYARLLSILRENHYRGDFIIEVYRKDFAQISELADAYRFLQSAGFESCFG